MTRTMKKFTGFVLMVCMIVSLFAGVTTAFAAKDFKDVPSDNWAKPYVDFVVDKGYFAGATADLFKPDDNMTRGMFVAVIAKVEGLTLDNNVAVDFNDVKSGKYYAGAVKWATDNGIVTGYGNGSFGPNDAITREQICVMMDKYIQYHDANNDTKYLDRKASVDFKDASDISSWAKDSVQKCVSYGLVQGFPDGKFYPKRNATRAEVSVMIYRLALWKEDVDGNEYKVSYKYESGTEGAELPAALNILIVPDSRTFHTGDVAEAYDPALNTFFAGGKQWKFEGYKEKTVTVKDADVEFVGVWVVESEAKKEYSVKYVYADIDGKAVVPVEAPKDEKTYKTGEKVTATNPESPVKTDKGVWTFVGWDKDGAKTMTETVADHDVVFTGYWKYTANKYHVTYVAKMYGTGEALPAEVAKELEGRCPVDKNEYEDGARVKIQEPKSKADYNDETGRAWNYKGSNYNIIATIKGADIEVIEYWGYAGTPFILDYSNSNKDVGGKMEMSAADTRNVNQTLPQPKIQTHYAGETVTIAYPTAMTVPKAENSLIVFPLYDVKGEWVFQYYEDLGTGKQYVPGKDKTFKMPTDSVSLVGHWQYFEYVTKVNYKNDAKSSAVKELQEELPDPSTVSLKNGVVPGDTISVIQPKDKTVKVDNTVFTYLGATIKTQAANEKDKRLFTDTSYTLKKEDLNGDGSVTVIYNWKAKEDAIKVHYSFAPLNAADGALPEKVTKLFTKEDVLPYPQTQTVSMTKDVVVPWELSESDKTQRVAGETWYWQGWDYFYQFNEGEDLYFVGKWSKTKTLVASYEFISSKQSQGLTETIVSQLPPNNIGLAKGEKFDLPTVSEVDGWTFLGWTTDPSGKKPAPAMGQTSIDKNTHYYGIWQKK